MAWLIVVLVLVMGAVSAQDFAPNKTLYFAATDTSSSQSLNVRLSYEPYEETWISFKKIYSRQYGNEKEDQYRHEVFMRNVKTIEEHNHKFSAAKSTFWMGINQFTDMTLEEYRAYNKLSGKPSNNTKGTQLQCSQFLPPLNFKAPASVDWRSNGYVTPIKNQGQCGSCWAFSSTGSLEGQHFRATNQLVPLSEQQLVDCSGSYGNAGCNGGWMNNAFAYIKDVGGIMSESAYPYYAQQGQCRFYKPWVVASLSDCKEISKYSESDLMQAVASQGPISVAIDATHPSFSTYSGGVYFEPQCDPSVQDHAVLVVGYGTTGGNDYWIVKNSWGESWGVQGYIFMARNQNNMCGIATDASFPVV